MEEGTGYRHWMAHAVALAAIEVRGRRDPVVLWVNILEGISDHGSDHFRFQAYQNAHESSDC